VNQAQLGLMRWYAESFDREDLLTRGFPGVLNIDLINTPADSAPQIKQAAQLSDLGKEYQVSAAAASVELMGLESYSLMNPARAIQAQNAPKEA
jgi:hypothetical protein